MNRRVKDLAYYDSQRVDLYLVDPADQIVGQLSEIEIVCQNSSVTVSYSPEMAWTVNRDGGDCSIKVFGDLETSFRLIELANIN